MPDMFNRRVVLGLKMFAWFSAIAALILGLGVLWGWIAGNPMLVTVRPGLAAMAPVTAACFTLSGLCLVARRSAWTRWADGLAGLVLAAGLLVLVGYLIVGRDVLNPLVGNRMATASGVLAGQTAPATACGFLLLGAILLALGRPVRLIVPGCGAAGVLLSGLALLGYAYGLEGLYAIRFYHTVALHTAAGLFVLYIGCLAHEPERGWAAILASGRPSGDATRVQLVLAVVIPFVTGLVLLRLVRAGQVAPSFALAAMAAFSTLPLMARIFLDGRMLDRLDMQLRGAAEQQRRLSEALDRRVQARTAELQRSEAALRQSQKMEAVGQLTGGLAHDFNNLLTGITGSLELLQTRLAQGRLGDLERYIDTAQGAATRAASLTHRLLAFSRRQALDPKPTDVNALVAGLGELLRRTMGPSVVLRTVLAGDLWATLLDPHQLENTLLNLAINARDAMPHGGTLTMETGNLVLGGAAAEAEGVPAGQYVALSVADTGTGMAPETISRAFDPFFTTKPAGVGTGLGLSMVYGFVQQSGGMVRITSDLGRGTCIRIILPRYRGLSAGAAATQTLATQTLATETLAAQPAGGQGRTVLVVDDEPSIRMLVTEVLDELGYEVIGAATGAAGLAVLQSGRAIDLLISDLGLPGGMNGRQMADAGRAIRPGLKVLFITGYAETAVLGEMENGLHVLSKPFAVGALAERVGALV